MKSLLITASLIVLAAPAFAARVTNLDTVPHVVTFERAGTVHEQTVQPQRTVHFTNADGMVGLKGGNPGKSAVTSDGLLKDLVGSGRSSRIPAGPGDNFTIWPGGKIYLQNRNKGLAHD